MPPLRLSKLLRSPISHRQTRHHSVSAHELSHFSNLASSWWDPKGPSRVLHLMNPLRHDFIASCLSDASTSNPHGLDYLDIGCGGGIFAESIARTIATSTATVTGPGTAETTGRRTNSVTGLDPSDTLIAIARAHARSDPVISALLSEGKFRYLNRSVEEHVSSSSVQRSSGESPEEAEGKSESEEAKPTYDVITLFEVLEHIDPATSSPFSFLSTCLRLLKPGGWLIGSTIARSLPSFVVNQVIAEAPWPVGVVPRGTHQWNKFANPDEVKGWVMRGLADGNAADSGTTAAGQRQGDMWKCAGVMYFPGFGWRMVDGSECWGNYFWGVRRGL